MEKRKYEVSVYSKGYGRVLFNDWVWAISPRQAFKLIKDRLVRNKNMEALYYWGMDDLPRHAVDITGKDEMERAEKREIKKNKDPMTRKKYDSCPKCGENTEADYCQACGWQRFAGAKKASVVGLKNNEDNNEEF
jgi:hypothetical protein